MDTQNIKDTIRVVLLEPGNLAGVTEIGTPLEDMQAAVGGYIEAIYPFSEEVALVCNEEAKLIGMPLNRALRQADSGEILDIIAGPCFLCNCSGESFGNLSHEQAVRYANQFRFPEQFLRVNTEIVAIPMLHRCSTPTMTRAVRNDSYVCDYSKQRLCNTTKALGRGNPLKPRQKEVACEKEIT